MRLILECEIEREGVTGKSHLRNNEGAASDAISIGIGAIVDGWVEVLGDSAQG